MPSWDRICTECGFHGSYLDFEPTTADVPEDQTCMQPTRDENGVMGVCGGTPEWEDQAEIDLEEQLSVAVGALKRIVGASPRAATFAVLQEIAAEALKTIEGENAGAVDDEAE